MRRCTAHLVPFLAFEARSRQQTTAPSSHRVLLQVPPNRRSTRSLGVTTAGFQANGAQHIIKRFYASGGASRGSHNNGKEHHSKDDADDDIFVKSTSREGASHKTDREAHDADDEEELFYDSHSGPSRGQRQKASRDEAEEDSGNAADHEDGSGPGLRVQATPSLRTAYAPSGIDLPESSFLKCIEKEIEDEKLRLDKEEGAPPAPQGWEVHHVKGSSVFYARRLWLPPATAPILTPSPRKQEGAHEKDNDADVEADGVRFPAKHERCMEKHFIRVQLTTRDAALDPECDIRGEHFPFSFFIQRIPPTASGQAGDAAQAPTTDAYSSLAKLHAPTFDEAEELSMYENSIEVRLDVVDGELVVDAVVYHGEREVLSQVNRRKLKPTIASATAETRSERANTSSGDVDGETDRMENPFCNDKTHRTTGLMHDGDAQKTKRTVAMYNDVFGGYPGPNLDEAEEEILDGIQAWLAERQIDDRFGEFVGQYSVWVEQMEYEAWLQQLYDYVAA